MAEDDAAEFTGLDQADRIKYLRERGVEVSLPEERAAEEAAAAAGAAGSGAAGETFSFVYVPADINSPVSLLTAEAGTGDALPGLLAPTFASNENMDGDTVARETAGRLKNMLVSGNLGGGHIKAPSAEEVQRQAADGVCEAYPLARYPSNGEGECVKLYIDEVGTLRGRPRNKRAEELAAAAGLHGLSIHGDGYVGRSCRRNGRECNASFGLEELSSSSKWVQAARGEHLHAAAEQGHRSDELLAGGDAGSYSWSQTDEDLEVRVRNVAPEGGNAKKRVGLSYGKGDKVVIKVDNAVVLELTPLFAKVVPDDCSWSIDKSDIVVTLTKGEERPWTELLLPVA